MCHAAEMTTHCLSPFSRFCRGCEHRDDTTRAARSPAASGFWPFLPVDRDARSAQLDYNPLVNRPKETRHGQGAILLGRPAAARRAADRRRADGPRCAARLLPGASLLPRVQEAFRHEKTDPEIFREMGAMGLLGPTIPTEYGGAGLNYVSYGLIAREVERVDSGYRSMMSVQSSLVMQPIFEFGSEAQKQKYLPKLASGEWIGCFGLTEPEPRLRPRQHGHPRAQRWPAATSCRGSKMWITNAPIADVFVVWAKDDAGNDSRLRAREGHERPVARRQSTARSGCAPRSPARSSWTRSSCPQENVLPRRARPQGPVHLPQLGALRHRLGRAGRGRVLLARGAPVHARPQAVRPAAGRQPVDPEEAGRHADRDHARPAGLPAPRPA